MTNIFEWTSEGPAVVLNQRGDKIPVHDGSSISFDDLVGARVKIQRRDREITCEAAVPESKGSFQWKVFMDNGEMHAIGNGTPLPPVRNLAALISECRVGLNGRW